MNKYSVTVTPSLKDINSSNASLGTGSLIPMKIYELGVKYPEGSQLDSFFVSDVIIYSPIPKSLFHPLKIQYFGIPLKQWNNLINMIRKCRGFEFLDTTVSISKRTDNYVWFNSDSNLNKSNIKPVSDINIRVCSLSLETIVPPTSAEEIQKYIKPENSASVGLLKDYLVKVGSVRGIGTLKIQIETYNTGNKLNVSLVGLTITSSVNIIINEQ